MSCSGRRHKVTRPGTGKSSVGQVPAPCPCTLSNMELCGDCRDVQGRVIVQACKELSAGDEIKARYRGALVHRGQVTEVVPGHGLFWKMDEITGGRKLLTVADLEITRA